LPEYFGAIPKPATLDKFYLVLPSLSGFLYINLIVITTTNVTLSGVSRTGASC
jgi:hypothetical protein